MKQLLNDGSQEMQMLLLLLQQLFMEASSKREKHLQLHKEHHPKFQQKALMDQQIRAVESTKQLKWNT